MGVVHGPAPQEGSKEHPLRPPLLQGYYSVLGQDLHNAASARGHGQLLLLLHLDCTVNTLSARTSTINRRVLGATRILSVS